MVYPDAGGEMAGVRNSVTTPIARKEVEILTPGASSYHVSIAEAKEFVSNGNGRWNGSRQIIRHQDFNIRGTWSPKPSGRNGPLVLQMQT